MLLHIEDPDPGRKQTWRRSTVAPPSDCNHSSQNTPYSPYCNLYMNRHLSIAHSQERQIPLTKQRGIVSARPYQKSDTCDDRQQPFLRRCKQICRQSETLASPPSYSSGPDQQICQNGCWALGTRGSQRDRRSRSTWHCWCSLHWYCLGERRG